MVGTRASPVCIGGILLHTIAVLGGMCKKSLFTGFSIKKKEFS
jgi:hypothetical protein